MVIRSSAGALLDVLFFEPALATATLASFTTWAVLLPTQVISIYVSASAADSVFAVHGAVIPGLAP